MARVMTARPSRLPSTANRPTQRSTGFLQAVPIPSTPSATGGEDDASATLTASEPVLKGIWSRHQASLHGKTHAASASLPDSSHDCANIHVEDLVSNVELFIQSVEKVLSHIRRAARNNTSYWGRKVSGEMGPLSDVARLAYLNLAQVFLSISEDRIASRALTRLTGGPAQVVLDTLQLVCVLVSTAHDYAQLPQGSRHGDRICNASRPCIPPPIIAQARKGIRAISRLPHAFGYQARRRPCSCGWPFWRDMEGKLSRAVCLREGRQGVPEVGRG